MTTTSFATVAELESVWKTLTTTEETRATALLQQASDYLRLIAKNNNTNIDDRLEYDDQDGIYAKNVKMVILNAVQRSMTAPTDMFPDASQWSQSASPYSESMSFSSGTGTNVYFKDKELKLLGFGSVSGRSSIGILRGVR